MTVLGFRCCASFPLVAASGGYSLVWRSGFPPLRPLSPQSTGSRCAVSSCGVWAQQLWLMGFVVLAHVESSQIWD